MHGWMDGLTDGSESSEASDHAVGREFQSHDV